MVEFGLKHLCRNPGWLPASRLYHCATSPVTDEALRGFSETESWKLIAMSEKTARLPPLCGLFTISPNAALCKELLTASFFHLMDICFFFLQWVLWKHINSISITVYGLFAHCHRSFTTDRNQSCWKTSRLKSGDACVWDSEKLRMILIPFILISFF